MPTTDADGNKLSEQDRKNIAKHQEIEKVLNQFFEIIFNYDKNTADSVLEKIKPMVTPEYIEASKKILEEDKKNNLSIKLVSADVITQDATIEWGEYQGKMYKDGNAVYTESDLEIIENGQNKKFTLATTLIYKDGKWLIVGTEPITKQE